LFIGERLRALREEKDFSQGDVGKRTGLLRCYISRVEHGYTVPAVETLEKFARALEVRRVSSSAEIASPGWCVFIHLAQDRHQGGRRVTLMTRESSRCLGAVP